MLWAVQPVSFTMMLMIPRSHEYSNPSFGAAVGYAKNFESTMSKATLLGTGDRIAEGS